MEMLNITLAIDKQASSWLEINTLDEKRFGMLVLLDQQQLIFIITAQESTAFPMVSSNA